MTNTTKQDRIIRTIKVHGTHGKSIKQLANYARVSTKTLVVRCSKMKAKGVLRYKIEDGKVIARIPRR